MVLMRPARLLRSDTKALRNSIANTAASSGNLLCETFERFFLRVLPNSNWSVVSELSSSSPSSKDASGFEANRVNEKTQESKVAGVRYVYSTTIWKSTPSQR